MPVFTNFRYGFPDILSHERSPETKRLVKMRNPVKIPNEDTKQ